MAWLDDIQDASFRGVPFYVEKDSAKGGRRVANHQYPKRDKPYAEDLGRKQESYTLEAFTLGDTAIADRNRLLAALRAGGPGTLVHPTLGSLRVQVGDWALSEDLVGEMRRCRVTLTFFEAGDIATPTVTTDTSAQAGAAAGAATTGNQAVFAGSFMA